MKVKITPSALRESKWYEYTGRFLIGGSITVFAGIIAKKFGPTVGGLFLAFPAIFPASATLIESHEKEKKKRARLDPGIRPQNAIALDSAGSTMGAIGLFVFALLTWRLLPNYKTWAVLLVSTIAWMIASVVVWAISEAV
ncbi:MAG TPA: DUF3147 family protein [Candidatus Acidoferrales bacterium]|nr:DUF3147 family protein [Candidatus Acidoferrales bacterium]